MTATEIIKYVGKKLRSFDTRTGVFHENIITDARTHWGKLQLQLEGSVKWFEPNNEEIKYLEQGWFS